jgi:thioredoxin 1
MRWTGMAGGTVWAAVMVGAVVTTPGSALARGDGAAAAAKDEAAGKPPIFAALSFEDARRANTGEKILVVKATAEWCGPCKQMDKTTWRDEKVLAWFKTSGTAISIDVDEEEKVAQDLKIEAMPTMIAFKEGKEFDRVVGFQDADDLLKWLDGVKQGKRSSDALRERASRETFDGVQARRELAQALMSAGRHDEAADHYVWLWDNMTRVAPPMFGVRLTFMASEMEELAAQSEAAKKRFVALRDAAEAKLGDGPAGQLARMDWVTLNRVVGDDARTLAWYDTMKGTVAGRRAAKEIMYGLDDLLIRNERWADYGRLVASPGERLKEIENRHGSHTNFEELPEDSREHFREYHREQRLHEISTFYASLLAAGRGEAAGKFAAMVLAKEDSAAMRMALVRRSAEIGSSIPEHLDWLAKIGAGEGADLVMEDVRAVLAKREAEKAPAAP